jgi:hypothetical protein
MNVNYARIVLNLKISGADLLFLKSFLCGAHAPLMRRTALPSLHACGAFEPAKLNIAGDPVFF